MKTFAIIYKQKEVESVIFYDNKPHNLNEVDDKFYLDLDESLVNKITNITYCISIFLENIKNYTELLACKRLPKSDRDRYSNAITKQNNKLIELYENIMSLINIDQDLNI